MKKHYKGLTVLLSACMLAGSASVAYAGPADDIANGTVGMPNTGSSTSAEQFNQGTGHHVHFKGDTQSFLSGIEYRTTGQAIG